MGCWTKHETRGTPSDVAVPRNATWSTGELGSGMPRAAAAVNEGVAIVLAAAMTGNGVGGHSVLPTRLASHRGEVDSSIAGRVVTQCSFALVSHTDV